jgi:large subunit ribosomal protein L6
MSRIGKNPISLPNEVKITLNENLCLVEGGKSKLELNIPKGITVTQEEKKLVVKRSGDTKQLKSLHGTIRMLIYNMIEGLTKGFKRELEIIGVGYKAQLKGNLLVLNIGFSHPVEMEVPQGLKVSVSGANKVTIEGVDKQKVGEFTAKLRRVYPPEPYKGKGIRFVGEEVRRKLGKALAK